MDSRDTEDVEMVRLFLIGPGGWGKGRSGGNHHVRPGKLG